MHDVRSDALLVLAVSLILVKQVAEEDEVLDPVPNTVLRNDTIRTQVPVLILFDGERNLLRRNREMRVLDFRLISGI